MLRSDCSEIVFVAIKCLEVDCFTFVFGVRVGPRLLVCGR